MPRRIKLIVEYDGTDFHGWQVQSSEARPEAVRTVQGELERALALLAGAPVRVAGAGRTDAGVHAAGQAASFDLPDGCRVPAEQLPAALNAHLPPGVCALSAAEMPADFHALSSARGKLYRYAILARTARSPLLRRTHWHVRFPLDAGQMEAAARFFIGRHDFSAFATQLVPTQTRRAEEEKEALETMREISAVEVVARTLVTAPDPQRGQAEDGDAAGGPREILISVEGSGFLYKMVRTMVGSLVEVGRGRQPPEWIAEALASKDRRRAGPTAPPHGLCLVRVFY